jgi:tRNA 2-thiouridine synthesizing protein A
MDNAAIEPDDQDEVEALLCSLKSIRACQCVGCGKSVCAHESLMSLVMGFKDAPRCLQCLSADLAQKKEELRDHLVGLITKRLCYNEGWVWANREEGFAANDLPGCLWPKDNASEKDGQATAAPFARSHDLSGSDLLSKFDVEWDAGDMGCGDLVLELRMRMQSLQSGWIMKLRAANSGAEKDIPSWCRMTGNTLLLQQRPFYIIKKK